MKRKFLIPFGKEKDFSIDYLLGIIYDARATTLERIVGISTEELHWQYKEGWNTIGVLLSHIIAVQHALRIIFIENRQLTPEEDALYHPALEMGDYIPQLINKDPIEVYLHKLEECNEKLTDAVRNLDTQSFHKKLNHYDAENGSNLAWIIYHFAEDEIHHRGQISILRKLYKSNCQS